MHRQRLARNSWREPLATISTKRCIDMARVYQPGFADYITLCSNPLKEPTLDRKLLKLPFRKINSPDWVCPTCNKGILRIKEGTFHEEELRGSREAHSHEAWEPEWIEYVYTCLLVCSNDKCREVVANSGTGSVDWDIVEDEHGVPDQVYEDFFRPKHFEPHLRLIHIPDDCPETVTTLLNESFKLFFSSPNAAANNVRAAIEELLTELKINRFSTSNGKRRFINLHQRIGLLPAKYAPFKDRRIQVRGATKMNPVMGG